MELLISSASGLTQVYRVVQWRTEHCLKRKKESIYSECETKGILPSNETMLGRREHMKQNTADSVECNRWIVVFWLVTPCYLAGGYNRFG
jgi:hypothetical protein